MSIREPGVTQSWERACTRSYHIHIQGQKVVLCDWRGNCVAVGWLHSLQCCWLIDKACALGGQSVQDGVRLVLHSATPSRYAAAACRGTDIALALAVAVVHGPFTVRQLPIMATQQHKRISTLASDASNPSWLRTTATHHAGGMLCTSGRFTIRHQTPG